MDGCGVKNKNIKERIQFLCKYLFNLFSRILFKFYTFNYILRTVKVINQIELLTYYDVL